MKTFEIKLSDRRNFRTVQALDIGKALTKVVGKRLLNARFSHTNYSGKIFNLTVSAGTSTEYIRASIKVDE